MVQAEQMAPTMEQLTGELEQAQSATEGLNKALALAVRSFEKAVKDGADTEAILDLGDRVRAAKKDVSDGEAAVAKAVSRIEFAEWQVNSKDLTDARQRIQTAHEHAVAAEMETLERFGATHISSTSVLSGDAVVGTKAFGDRIPKQPSKGKARAASNGGGGFRSHGKIYVGGNEYPSTNAAYRTLRGAADGVAPNDVTAANNKSATSWLEQNVGPVTSA